MAARMVAAQKKRRRKSSMTSSLSVSLPDVSQDTAAFDVQAVFQQFAEAPYPPLLSNPARTSTAKHNIDDDTWSDKADPTTGFVFHVDSPTKPTRLFSQASAGDGVPHPLSISHSNSSLSSTQSVSDVAPGSPTSVVSTSIGFSSRFTQSLRLNSYPEVEEEERGTASPVPANDVFTHERTSSRSLKKKIAKAVRGTSKRFRRRSYETGSLSDLHFAEQQSLQLPSFPETPSPSRSTLVESIQVPLPQTTLVGSQGLPLHHIRDLRGPSVRIDISQFQLGVGLTPCSLDTLGIVPARSLIKGKFGSLSSLVAPRNHSRGTFKQHYPPSYHPVIIRGVIPGSPVAVTQNLHEGDTIQSVNGHSVYLENIDSVLAGLSNEVHFTIKKGHNHEIPTHFRSRHTNHTPVHVPGGLVRLVMGGRSAVKSHVSQLIEHPHLLLYLTLDTKEDDPDEKDILYRFPSQSQPGEGEQDKIAALQRDLIKVRGIFLTLSDVLGSLICPAPSCSTILLDGHLIHVGYVQFDKELLLLAFPAERVSQYEVQLIVDNTKKLLVLLYGSVTRAFSNPSHHSTLDHLFALMFDLVLGKPDDSAPVAFSSSSLTGLPTAPQLKIPADVRVRLSTALSGLDSADHNNRPEILNLRRPFLVLGSCLFYHGALACSHLRDEQLREVVRFCQAYRLLELTAAKSINQVVIWREVYLSELNQSEEKDEVYSPHNGRTFLLIVGLERTLVCMLMQQMKLHPSGEVTPPTIDAVYVDRARSLIMELKAQDLLAECDGRGLHSTPLPALMSADIALASVYTKSASFRSAHASSRRQSESAISSPLRSRKSSWTPDTSKQADGSDSDEARHDVLEKPPVASRRRAQSFLSTGTQVAKQKRKMSGPNLQSINEVGVKAAAAANNNSRTFRPAYMLTSGIDNMLLHYVNLCPGRGALVCPTYATPPGPVQTELLKCFQRTCLFIRQVLRGSAAEGVECVESESESDEDVFDWSEDGWGGVSENTKKKKEVSPFAPRASSVVEHGVLLHCTPSSPDKHKKQTTPTLHYWVVGRLIRESDTELYVCFQDNMSQNMIEMSFKLLFGWAS